MTHDVGVYYDMDYLTYRNDPCPMPSLNQSLIPALVNRSPLHAAFEHPRLNPYAKPRSATSAQLLGEAVHRLALGRGRGISTIRYKDFSSQSARDDRDEALRNNRIPILEWQRLEAEDMARTLRERIEEACEGNPYATEVVLIWKERTMYGEVYCRCQIDVFCEALALVLDPKALRISATAGAFGKTAADSGYAEQAVFYKRGLAVLMPELKDRLRFANLVVENYPPFAAQSFAPDTNTLYVAERQCATAVELFAKCLHSRSWPGYPRGIQEYATPAWHQQRIINS